MLPGSRGWLKQSVTIANRTGNSETGWGTYGAGVAIACRVETISKLVAGPDNALITSTTAIYVDGDTEVGVDSEITLPDGSKPNILAVESYPGPDGRPYLKVIRT